MTAEQRKKLNQLTNRSNYRAKVTALLKDVESKGEKPEMFETIRTYAQQVAHFKAGRSKTMKSNHFPGSDGFAKAVDIADGGKEQPWNQATKRFWLLIGSSCMARGLGWGGLFGRTIAQRKAIMKAILQLRAAGWPQKHFAYDVIIGWDPAHVELGSNWPTM